MVGFSNYDASKIPLNKRYRRRMAEVTTLVIHLYAGSDFKKWRDLETADLDGKESGLVILCLDVEKGHDLHNPHLMGFLEKFACDGRIAVLLGGPPCRTVSVARHRDDEGPRPARGRGRYARWGLRTNTPQEQELCDNEMQLCG